VAVTITVALTGVDPVNETELGKIEHAECAGAPLQALASDLRRLMYCTVNVF
jgi:hypothetical protein